jgi:pimeloyl-ACP methyl ester carboxylesterase
MIESLKAVAEFFGPARGVIAHSLGCGVTARTILEGGLTTERLALISPNADMRELAVRFGRSLGFRARTCDLMIRDIEGWGRRIADLDVTAMGGQAPLPAPLIVHDRQDKQVPFQTSVDIEANWPGSRFVATDGLGHFRVLIDPNVIRAATTAILSDEALPTPP